MFKYVSMVNILCLIFTVTKEYNIIAFQVDTNKLKEIYDTHMRS